MKDTYDLEYLIKDFARHNWMYEHADTLREYALGEERERELALRLKELFRRYASVYGGREGMVREMIKHAPTEAVKQRFRQTLDTI